ncbi:hypothetical protein TRV_04768 [Trichophyton verrucosum HKI 0517]|uniref:Uncharacterized protein n=1 Tax=Trichophyton verrucosum (strain HKI 0517) TaxID=663202 RepID=D4DCB5_TRIVH|nr:uncharacterized protein TRV_04768 [Trichophyton verrucosum HKI 0517]EFE40535.1 hypothetical protein TRV_04768 [Trichophyton verrucosum HKI 0517]
MLTCHHSIHHVCHLSTAVIVIPSAAGIKGGGKLKTSAAGLWQLSHFHTPIKGHGARLLKYGNFDEKFKRPSVSCIYIAVHGVSVKGEEPLRVPLQLTWPEISSSATSLQASKQRRSEICPTDMSVVLMTANLGVILAFYAHYLRECAFYIGCRRAANEVTINKQNAIHPHQPRHTFSDGPLAASALHPWLTHIRNRVPAESQRPGAWARARKL